MPRRKIERDASRPKINQSPKITKKKVEKTFRWGESYTSLLLGVIVVIIGALFVGSLIKTQHTRSVSSTNTVVTRTPSKTPPIYNFGSIVQRNYIVKPGDDLWSIAVQEYNNGYLWVNIAKANNITNSGMIFKGDKLIIPNIINGQQKSTHTQIVQNNTAQENGSSEAISGTSYTVKKNDTLWSIAVRAYADGYKWVDIARANQLANPGLIYSGNIFKIPR